jgi:hypothetical protein
MNYLSLIVVLLVLGVVHGYHNVTVDDTSSSIVYTGVWMPTSDETNAIDYGGSHHVSQQQGSTATFSFTGTVIKQLLSHLVFTSFTGVAFYYMAPLWPYAVTTVVTLDGSPITVDLQDHSAAPQPCCGAEVAASRILGSFAGLSNNEHQVVCSMAPGGQFVVLDAFVYVQRRIFHCIAMFMSDITAIPLPIRETPHRLHLLPLL